MMKPLQDRRILVTRPAAQAGQLATMITENGGEALLFPLIEIGATDDPAPLQQAIAQLPEYSLAIFISPNAALFSVPQILAAMPWPSELHAAAIGPGTATQLAALGITPVIVPDQRFDSAGLLERAELRAESIAGKRVLILRGNGGREELADTLRERGAQVDAITVYRRTPPNDGPAHWLRLRETRIDALTISSSEALRNLAECISPRGDDKVFRLPVFVPHPRIAEVASELGWKNIVLTQSTDAGIIEALCAYAWSNDEPG